ncbi:ubiquitin carboxyl-terminal hydrolase 25-like isoform X1 [Ornithodoros turicata]|uniref:ubiquitin carboxyl-terminal hydrolase 25-like isoform X1 n=2 Tax=Ornithodoros turicata TaxID=34597 RepID=UPI00313919C6
MTVEQSPLDNHCKQPPLAEHEQRRGEELVLEQLREITGVKDERILGQALEASRTRSGRYDLSHAISMLVDEEPATRAPEGSGGDAVNGSSPQKRPAKVIDLTTEGDDLQKAIALSLQEQQQQQQQVVGVSVEEQDISRALEQSLGTKRKRGEAWQDPLDPHERRRQGDWPVGLKNIGNTCWFSAVIQSLFHLRAFRRLLLAFEPGEGERHELMMELRRLFGLLGATERKYVDPSGALAVLRDALLPGASPDGQQDVSEFTHKLLDWLEDAFQTAHRESEQQDNPMLNLFYGRYRSEGENEGRTFSNEAKFGQYPLQVNGFSDIHESLEAAVTQEFECAGNSRGGKSGQQSWFTRLPPVLVFELSRFQFNQALGKPEKIHHRLDFPELLYMDRYMEYNKNITRSKREEVRRLQQERDRLRKRLEKYINYGSGPKHVPLQDVLQYTLEFVESRAGQDVEMGSSVLPREPPENAAEPRSASGDMLQPTPRHVTDAELRVLQSCLRRWHHEVENDVKELQEGVRRLDVTIREIYNDASLRKVAYRLHAVLVHEGQAASGHYWAFVWCPKRSAWLKFNDVTVSETSWSDLLKDSVGGRHCASAYCLFYVDRSNKELFDEVKDAELELPDDLARYVEEDNALFRSEMEQWDREQRREQERSQEQEHSRSTRSHHTSIDTEAGELSGLELEHAHLVLGTTQNRLQQLGGEPKALAKVLEQEEARLQRLARMHNTQPLLQDVRLQHPGVYLLLNGASSGHLKRLLLEQFAHPALEDDGPQGHHLRQEALQCLAHLKRLHPQDDHYYHCWHQAYSRFRKVAATFVAGVEELWAGHAAVALPLLVDAWNLNLELQKSSGSPTEKRHLAVDSRLLTHFRRQCLLEVNRRCVQQFESGNSDSPDPLQLMSQLVIPCMAPMSDPNADSSDVAAVEEVRNSWCSMLALNMPADKQKQLQDFLSALLEPNTADTPARPLAPVVRNADLSGAFEKVMQRVVASGQWMDKGTPL